MWKLVNLEKRRVSLVLEFQHLYTNLFLIQYKAPVNWMSMDREKLQTCILYSDLPKDANFNHANLLALGQLWILYHVLQNVEVPHLSI